MGTLNKVWEPHFPISESLPEHETQVIGWHRDALAEAHVTGLGKFGNLLEITHAPFQTAPSQLQAEGSIARRCARTSLPVRPIGYRQVVEEERIDPYTHPDLGEARDTRRLSTDLEGPSTSPTMIRSVDIGRTTEEISNLIVGREQALGQPG
jgi:hypothetical protein